MLTLNLRHQKLAADAAGRIVWQVVETPVSLDPARLAIIVCDVWDHHWCVGAEQRLEVLLSRMEQTLYAARARGAHIIHARPIHGLLRQPVAAAHRPAPSRDDAPERPHEDPRCPSMPATRAVMCPAARLTAPGRASMPRSPSTPSAT